MEEKQTFRKIRRAQSPTDYETWGGCQVANTINTFENSDVRTTTIVTEIYTFEPGVMSRWGALLQGHMRNIESECRRQSNVGCEERAIGFDAYNQSMTGGGWQKH